MKARYHISFVGPPEVRTSGGKQVALKGAKTIALFAILAAANGRAHSRAWLQDKLWSRTGSNHGRDSLKKSLGAIRRLFRSLGDEVLDSQGGPVALRRELFSIDVFDDVTVMQGSSGLELLEGLDEIPEEGLRDWLRDFRTSTVARFETLPPELSHIALAPKPQPRRLRLGIAPLRWTGFGSDVELSGDMLLNRVATGIRDRNLVDVYDLRHIEMAERPDVDAMMSTRVVAHGGRFAVSLILTRSIDGQIIFGRECIFKNSNLFGDEARTEICHLIEQVVDAALHHAATTSPETAAAARLVSDSVNQIWSLDTAAFDEIERKLQAAIELEPKGSYYAWLAYMAAFRFEESKGLDNQDWRARTDLLAARALESDPHTPLIRALLTHVYAFVFKDFGRAAETIRPIEDSAADQPMAYHSLSLLNFYAGKVGRAREIALAGRQAARFHPYAYAFSTTCSMIEMTSGNIDGAIHYGEEALARQTLCSQYYEPTLRYLSSSYMLAGRRDRALDLWGRLSAQSSEPMQMRVIEEGLAVPNPEAQVVLKTTFRDLAATMV
ncbi:MAG: hypothetical protein ACPGGK_08305 [Pikeienuella sp.]